jgi:hypothetical protein
MGFKLSSGFVGFSKKYFKRIKQKFFNCNNSIPISQIYESINESFVAA